MQGFSEEGLAEMFHSMYRLSERDLTSRKGKHFHSAVLYLGGLGRLEEDAGPAGSTTTGAGRSTTRPRLGSGVDAPGLHHLYASRTIDSERQQERTAEGKKDVRYHANAYAAIEKSKNVTQDAARRRVCAVEACGRSGCKCANGALHGPYFYRFWRERGRLRKAYVKPADLDAVRAACAKERDLNQTRRLLHALELNDWRCLTVLLREGEKDD